MSKLTDSIYETIENLSSPGRGFSHEDFADEAKCERVREDGDTFRKVEEMVKSFGDIVNRNNGVILEAGLVNGLNKTHRYLQQGVVISLLKGLGDLGALYQENPGMFADGRNEFSMKLLVKLRAALKDELFYRDGQ